MYTFYIFWNQKKKYNYFHKYLNSTLRNFFFWWRIRSSRFFFIFSHSPCFVCFLQVVFLMAAKVRRGGRVLGSTGVSRQRGLHCTEWSLTVMQKPMFPWKPLSTTEYTRAIFEPFVRLINYVFVVKAAWLDCLIM